MCFGSSISNEIKEKNRKIKENQIKFKRNEKRSYITAKISKQRSRIVSNTKVNTRVDLNHFPTIQIDSQREREREKKNGISVWIYLQKQLFANSMKNESTVLKFFFVRIWKKTVMWLD